MVRKTSSWIGTILFLTSLTAYAGGPPILTTSKVPEYFIVGRAKTLVFVVRGMCCDHGPLDHRNYRVRATAAGERKIEIPAIPTANPGEYAATLTLPAPGDWAITVDFYDFKNDSNRSPQIHRRALLSGSRLPEELSLEARGERNFVEKGCITCHVNREVVAPAHDPWGSREELESILLKNGIPDLTGRRFPQEYLVRFLTNPSSVKSGTNMPNLKLSNDDISALVAFYQSRKTNCGFRIGTLRSGNQFAQSMRSTAQAGDRFGALTHPCRSRTKLGWIGHAHADRARPRGNHSGREKAVGRLMHRSSAAIYVKT